MTYSHITTENVRVIGKDGEVVFDGRATMERFDDGRMTVTPLNGIFAADADVSWPAEAVVRTEGGAS